MPKDKDENEERETLIERLVDFYNLDKEQVEWVIDHYPEDDWEDTLDTIIDGDEDLGLEYFDQLDEWEDDDKYSEGAI